MPAWLWACLAVGVKEWRCLQRFIEMLNLFVSNFLFFPPRHPQVKNGLQQTSRKNNKESAVIQDT